MKEIGAFICNYNKAEFVVKCVKKVMEQTYTDIDIFVVDNASTDDSVYRLYAAYGDQITILKNKENLGGSGGFGRGIRTALELGYKYFMLIDNDAFLDERAVEYLHEYMENHKDVGICGSETLYLQEPEKIQDLGGKIDYNCYQWGGIIGGLTELSGNAVLECDYVASNSVIARTEAVRDFGGFDEENFIYWDDIEWCTKCWRAGYKVVVNGYAKAWHDMSGAGNRNMFLRYYANRNRYKFFVKYLEEEQLENFYETIMNEFFFQNYGAMKKGMIGTVMTAWNALDDFMHGITGRAAEGKIVPYSEEVNPLAESVRTAEKILIYMSHHKAEDYQVLNNVLRYILLKNPSLMVKVSFDESECESDNYDYVLWLCRHVTRVKENILPYIYVDRYCNCVMNENDFWYFSNYEKAKDRFLEMYRPLFYNRVDELRKL